jgi:hypothetical protein
LIAEYMASASASRDQGLTRIAPDRLGEQPTNSGGVGMVGGGVCGGCWHARLPFLVPNQPQTNTHALRLSVSLCVCVSPDTTSMLCRAPVLPLPLLPPAGATPPPCTRSICAASCASPSSGPCLHTTYS